MRDVSAWLQRLGLGKYTKAFEDSEIDFNSLPHVTENMLEQIGVPVGPRARLLAAISVASSPPHEAPQTLPDDAQEKAIGGRAPSGGTSSDHGDVLRPGELDQARQRPRPGGFQVSDASLPEHVPGSHRALRRPHIPISWRRSRGVFRLAGCS